MRWTIDGLKRDIEIYRGHVAMAKREINAGNLRLRGHLEGYASHLDSLVYELATLEGKNEIHQNSG